MAIYKHHTEADIFRWHSSPEDYLAYVTQDGVRESSIVGMQKNDTNWAGDVWEKAIAKLEKGDATRTALASKLYEDIIQDMTPTTGRNIIAPAIVGFVPNIPAVLAGQPETMFQRQETDDISCYAPMRIFMETAVSSSVTAAQLINRGVALLAFTMVMNTVRPIELYTVSSAASDEGHGSYGWQGTASNIVRIETRPLDVSRAAWMLTDPAYARRIGFSAIKFLSKPRCRNKNNPDDSLPMPWGNCGAEQYQKNMRAALKMEQQDVLVMGAYGNDRLMLNDPKKWVNEQVKKHIEAMEGTR